MTTLAGVTSATIRQHEPWVRRQAQALVRHLPANVERSDLVQVGLLAVATSAVTFEWDGGGAETEVDAFARYARMRVKGAMLDELRQMDFLSRGERRKVKRIQVARQRHGATHGTEAPLSHLAAATGLSAGEIGALLQADAMGRHQADVDDESGHGPAQRNHPSTTKEGVEDLCGTRHMLRAFCDFVERLPEREQMVLDAYLGIGPNVTETAAALGVTPSRVSQIFYGLVRRIAAKPWAGVFEEPEKARPAPLQPIVTSDIFFRPAPVVFSEPEPEVEPPEYAGPVEHLFAEDIVRGCGVDLLR